MASKLKFSKGYRDLVKGKLGAIAREALSDPKLANRIKNKITLRIKKDGIMPNSKVVKPLAPSTIENRKRIARYNRVSKFFKASKSNLTLTGQFLRSFKATIKEKTTKLGNASVLFKAFPTGDHKPYKSGKKKKGKPSKPIKSGGGLSNEELGQYLIDGGRDYTEIGTEVKNQITKTMKSAILKQLKINLRRK